MKTAIIFLVSIVTTVHIFATPFPPPFDTALSSFSEAPDTNLTTILSDWEPQCRKAIDRHLPTSIEGCKPLFNKISKWKDYRDQQEFIEASEERYSRPKIPHKPPYVLFSGDEEAGTPTESDCAILIGAEEKNVMSKFSFFDARQMVIDILQYCSVEEGRPGRGGSAAIGTNRAGERMSVWSVTVLGRAKKGGGGGGDVVVPGGGGGGVASFETE